MTWNLLETIDISMAYKTTRVPMTIRTTLLYTVYCYFLLTGICSAQCDKVATDKHNPNPNKPEKLYLSQIGTFPDNSILLSGYFQTSLSQRILPALVYSSDSGNQWERYHFNFPGERIEFMQTEGLANAWLFLAKYNEGTITAKRLLKSHDGGKTWCQTTITLATPEAPVAWPTTFEMLDTQFGRISYADSLGGKTEYYTNNAGTSWTRLWHSSGHANIDRDFLYPAKALPPHAPVWEKIGDFYKVSAILRLRPIKKNYVVEQYDYTTDAGWKLLSRLKR